MPPLDLSPKGNLMFNLLKRLAAWLTRVQDQCPHPHNESVCDECLAWWAIK